MTRAHSSNSAGKRKVAEVGRRENTAWLVPIRPLSIIIFSEGMRLAIRDSAVAVAKSRWKYPVSSEQQLTNRVKTCRIAGMVPG